MRANRVTRVSAGAAPPRGCKAACRAARRGSRNGGPSARSSRCPVDGRGGNRTRLARAGGGFRSTRGARLRSCFGAGRREAGSPLLPAPVSRRAIRPRKRVGMPEGGPALMPCARPRSPVQCNPGRQPDKPADRPSSMPCAGCRSPVERECGKLTAEPAVTPSARPRAFPECERGARTRKPAVTPSSRPLARSRALPGCACGKRTGQPARSPSSRLPARSPSTLRRKRDRLAGKSANTRSLRRQPCLRLPRQRKRDWQDVTRALASSSAGPARLHSSLERKRGAQAGKLACTPSSRPSARPRALPGGRTGRRRASASRPS